MIKNVLFIKYQEKTGSDWMDMRDYWTEWAVSDPACNLDEAELLRSAQEGSLDAFNQLVLIHQQDVYNLACWIVRDRQTAEDITQETFIKAYQRVRDLRGESIRSWLLRVTRNACIDELRRRKRQPVLSMVVRNDEGEEFENLAWLADKRSLQLDLEQGELSQAMNEWIQELHSRYAFAMILVDVMTLDYAEAARVMSVPVGTVKSRVARARMHMRARLVQYQRDGSAPRAEQFARRDR